jgi:1-aminocyclopropane-1-carboxylate deaminase
MFSIARSNLVQLELPILNKHNIKLFIKRDDLIHPIVSGNKWRKLKYNIELLKNNKKEGVLTFGGAFSNHLVATAFACKEAGLKSIGIVRGEELNANSNATLKQCAALGMDLVFVDRMTYELRHDKNYHEELSYTYENYFIIPEGGANYYGMLGCQEILKEIDVPYDALVVAQGTATTSVGLLLGLHSNADLWVAPALKGYDSINEMKTLLRNAAFSDEIIEDYLPKVNILNRLDLGSYGKWDKNLEDFILDFFQQTQIPLDVVYTAKAMRQLLEEISKGTFNDQQIVFIHTGGLQGNPDCLNFIV